LCLAPAEGETRKCVSCPYRRVAELLMASPFLFQNREMKAAVREDHGVGEALCAAGYAPSTNNALGFAPKAAVRCGLVKR
jgi:hypothetical protein